MQGNDSPLYECGDFGLAEDLTEKPANNLQMVLIDRTDNESIYHSHRARNDFPGSMRGPNRKVKVFGLYALMSNDNH